MSMKNSDTIGNRSRDLPVCSAVVEPPRAPKHSKYSFILFLFFILATFFGASARHHQAVEQTNVLLIYTVPVGSHALLK
jgi:hypothetical protein